MQSWSLDLQSRKERKMGWGGRKRSPTSCRRKCHMPLILTDAQVLPPTLTARTKRKDMAVAQIRPGHQVTNVRRHEKFFLQKQASLITAGSLETRYPRKIVCRSYRGTAVVNGCSAFYLSNGGDDVEAVPVVDLLQRFKGNPAELQTHEPVCKANTSVMNNSIDESRKISAPKKASVRCYSKGQQCATAIVTT